MSSAEGFRRLVPVPTISPPKPNADVGEEPRLEWLPIDRLIVDDRYQRAIGKQGRPNVIRILENFSWNKFSPIVVTPAFDGLFAIIDGQHHATAALMHPAISKVPCYVVDVTPEEAAACFAAINGQVTATTNGQIWKARVMAGDKDAAALNAILQAAGVTILAYKLPANPYRVGETLAVRTLEIFMKKCGPTVLVTALQAVTQTGNGNPGCLIAPVIKAMCSLVEEIDVFQKRPTMLFDLMDEVNLPQIILETGVKAKREKREHAAVLRELLADYMVAAMGAQT